MMSLIATDQSSPTADWPALYLHHLDQRLQQSLIYLRSSSPASVRSHMRSFLTLLQETHRYPSLTQKALEFIAALHPQPVRWGLGQLWEPELLFALGHISSQEYDLRFEYHCDLGDVYAFSGQFEKAVAQAERVLTGEIVKDIHAARAALILFNCLRSTGQPHLADEWIERLRPRFLAGRPAVEIPSGLRQAWLHFNQCELELLRERGQIQQALDLVEEMIWLDQREGNPDPSQTADLYTHRSTLLWVQGRYHEAAADLHRAIELFKRQQDEFNAESLQSNLGLVYLMMGDLNGAERSLHSAIEFYRRTGSQQLLAYDTGNLGLVYFAQGELDLALQLTREHIDHAQKLNFISEYNRGLRNLGTVLYYFGEYQQAIDALQTCHVYYEKRGSRNAYWLDLVWLALCRHSQGEQDKALAMMNEALEWSIKLESEVLEQLTLRGLAMLLPADQRLEPLLKSLDLAHRNNRMQEKAAVLLTLASIQPEPDLAETNWQEGCAILKEIGAEK
jgi:tetratricopeptide (TPR) repeat protein